MGLFTVLQAFFATANNSSMTPFSDRVDIVTSKRTGVNSEGFPQKKKKTTREQKHQKNGISIVLPVIIRCVTCNGSKKHSLKLNHWASIT